MSDMRMSMTVTGGPELARKLGLLSDAMAGKTLERAALSGALLIRNAASANAPYRTGTLRRSIHAEATETSRTHCEVEIGTDVVYAAQVEYGGTIKPKKAKMLSWVGADGTRVFAKSVTQVARPYLRPAFDEKRDEAVTQVGNSLKILLAKVAVQ